MLKWFRKVFGGEQEAAPQQTDAAAEVQENEAVAAAPAESLAAPMAAEAPAPAESVELLDVPPSLPSASAPLPAEDPPAAAAPPVMAPPAEAAFMPPPTPAPSAAPPATDAEPIAAPLLEPEPEAEPEPQPEPEVTPTPEPEPEPEPAPRGFFARLRERLTRTTETLVGAVKTAIGLHGKVDEDLLQEIEDILIQSDVGVPTTLKIVERMRKEGRKQGEMTPDAVLTLFKQSIEEILSQGNRPLVLDRARPMILLFVGVNGTGKTTTIGKLAQTLAGQGKLVMMVAADTFRAAAADQLQIWAERTDSCIVRQPEGSDPAAVVYEALEGAVAGPTPDVILIDTAGRLHTKLNLMEQLKKIVRIIKRHYPEAPQETILVLDATTGQNAVNQVKLFHEACELTGLIMTKLDGTAKGGILIACKDLYTLPIFKIGIGEQADDLRDFNPHEFAEALFSGK